MLDIPLSKLVSATKSEEIEIKAKFRRLNQRLYGDNYSRDPDKIQMPNWDADMTGGLKLLAIEESFRWDYPDLVPESLAEQLWGKIYEVGMTVMYNSSRHLVAKISVFNRSDIGLFNGQKTGAPDELLQEIIDITDLPVASDEKRLSFLQGLAESRETPRASQIIPEKCEFQSLVLVAMESDTHRIDLDN